jgi:hypothetical protein
MNSTHNTPNLVRNVVWLSRWNNAVQANREVVFIDVCRKDDGDDTLTLMFSLWTYQRQLKSHGAPPGCVHMKNLIKSKKEPCVIRLHRMWLFHVDSIAKTQVDIFGF